MSKPRSTKAPTNAPVSQPASARFVMAPSTESQLLRRVSNFSTQFRDSQDVDKVVASALRLSLDFFGASEGCAAVVRPGRSEAEILQCHPPASRWDGAGLARFLHKEDTSVEPDLMFSRVRRFGRKWGALVLRSPRAEFGWDARQAFSTVGAAATQLIERIENERVREVRGRIDQKILAEISPKNLFYQILHGLRSLISYDHSAALLTVDDDDRGSLQLVGEQIAWRKAKSQRIGQRIPLHKPLWDLLVPNVVCGFNREGDQWRDWTGMGAESLAEALDYNRDPTTPSYSNAEGAMLCAPLVTRREVQGVLKVSAQNPGTFGPYEAGVISQFLPQVAIALQNMRRTESLRMRMQAAERQHAMADFARGVSHDVNNALGAVLPLVQQMRADLDDGAFDPATVRNDLAEIEKSLQVCRRIFGGMISFARRSTLNASDVFLHQAVEGTLAVFRDVLRHNRIEILVNVPANLPPIRGIQADVEQLLLNLVGNARDAMQSGGLLSIDASHAQDQLVLTVADTGCGIPASHLSRVQEPFFTTKSSGSGLGLSICHSIVSQMRGKLIIESREGHGTTIRITLSLPNQGQP